MLKKIFIIFLFNFTLILNAQVPTNESLVSLAIARDLYDQKNLGDALSIAQENWHKQPNSEASFLVGQIYDALGEYLLASKHYTRAVNEDTSYKYRPKYLYALANSYSLLENKEDSLKTLNTIIEEAFPRGELKKINREKKVATTLLVKDGLSYVFKLYRWNDNYATKAIELIAYDYYIKNLNEKDALLALEGFLYSFLTKTNNIFLRLNYYRPNYEFTSIKNLLDDAVHYNELLDYMEDSSYFASYYFLACSIYNYNRSSQAKVLFNHLRQIPEAKRWATRAKKQFESQFLDEENKME